MRSILSGVLAGLLALACVSAVACPSDKAKDDKQMSTPSKPKT